MLLEPGTLAPDFTAPDQHGNPFTLSSLRGRRVALYFYPKDDTPGCTAQACNLRDNESQLAAQGISVVGVSTDDTASHARFAAKYDLNFPLIADPDKTIVNAYGVWQEKKNYGKIYWGTVRTTFLLDANGLIEKVIKRPDTKEHAAQVLK
ncbi:thioredoxin-dependent thiol peroxidase [Hymenobacter sp. BRD67]|uniref:thioredoxin-dependent thiol peroxidase n=1 Tax=Hymenobacter sp. BRD67 TaxID=2675877 RepID=UPI001566EAFE|nr:thioredoxin-dependent thiol peroxidase [Hymenobacter sp. BRD67]QKG53093.1 thioredoxin-dependent thiol peroxidase [Hymenobacter sp. BRD67]